MPRVQDCTRMRTNNLRLHTQLVSTFKIALRNLEICKNPCLCEQVPEFLPWLGEVLVQLPSCLTSWSVVLSCCHSNNGWNNHNSQLCEWYRIRKWVAMGAIEATGDLLGDLAKSKKPRTLWIKLYHLAVPKPTFFTLYQLEHCSVYKLRICSIR